MKVSPFGRFTLNFEILMEVNKALKVMLGFCDLEAVSLENIYFKDSAYFCYCAYVLCISRYSGFLWVVPTNTGTFFV